MNDPVLNELGALTDALLAIVRAPDPDLESALLLLGKREQVLAALSAPPTTEQRRQRIARLHDIQAANAELRSRLEERLGRVQEELRVLANRNRLPNRRPVGAGILDRNV